MLDNDKILNDPILGGVVRGMLATARRVPAPNYVDEEGDEAPCPNNPRFCKCEYHQDGRG